MNLLYRLGQRNGCSANGAVSEGKEQKTHW